METWKDIPGWEGKYQASDLGRVRNKTRVMRQMNHTGGYLKMTLWRNGVSHQTFVHALILETFVGPRPQGFQACHNDGNKKNNNLKNLRWDTPSQNQIDRDFHGSSFFGKKRKVSRLYPEKVLVIKTYLNLYQGNATTNLRYGTSAENGLDRKIHNRIKIKNRIST